MCTESLYQIIIKYMSTLQQVFKVEESEKKNSILEILSDKYCRVIIEFTMHKPKSAIDIIAEANIPMSTLHRIQTLHDNNLLRTSGIITEEGGHRSLEIVCTELK